MLGGNCLQLASGWRPLAFCLFQDLKVPEEMSTAIQAGSQKNHL